MSDDRVELKPCPFPTCGSTDVELVDFEKGGEHRWHRVECRECEARGPEIRGCSSGYWGAVQIEEYRQQAIAAWNTRTLDPSIESLQAEVENAATTIQTLERSGQALVSLIDRLAEGQCGPFAIKNSIVSSFEMDAMREALERAKGYKMSPEEIFEQKVSFVYGQQDYDNPNPKSKDEIRQMLIESQGRPACEKCAEAAAMLKAAVEALEASRQTIDDLLNYALMHDCGLTENRVESLQSPLVTRAKREIRLMDNTLASLKQPGGR